jgi:hypothetical protein
MVGLGERPLQHPIVSFGLPFGYDGTGRSVMIAE